MNRTTNQDKASNLAGAIAWMVASVFMLLISLMLAGEDFANHQRPGILEGIVWATTGTLILCSREIILELKGRAIFK